MIIKEFRKIGLILAAITVIAILIFTRRYEYAICYILGVIVSNINLTINELFLDLSGSRQGIMRNLGNYILRVAIYAAVMILAIKWMDVAGLLCAFIGCLNIRIAITIDGIKGGLKNGYSK